MPYEAALHIGCLLRQLAGLALVSQFLQVVEVLADGMAVKGNLSQNQPDSTVDYSPVYFEPDL